MIFLLRGRTACFTTLLAADTLIMTQSYLPIAISQSYEQKPFYVSEEDKREAILGTQLLALLVKKCKY
jgi:hypothetical protein